jgi:hypothetical protein
MNAKAVGNDFIVSVRFQRGPSFSETFSGLAAYGLRNRIDARFWKGISPIFGAAALFSCVNLLQFG